MTEFNRDADVFEHAHRPTTEIVSDSTGNVVEVACLVDGLCSPVFPITVIQEVELDLGVCVEREPLF